MGRLRAASEPTGGPLDSGRVGDSRCVDIGHGRKIVVRFVPGGWKWSLPTEAQWERACRGGTTTATSFGDSLASTQANFDGEEPNGGAAPGGKLGKSCPVGKYPANPYGLFDMHGNVWEWCLDGYQWRLPGGLDPVLTDSDRRVIRGGSWSVNGNSCRAAMRGRCEPGQAEADVGLRPIITRAK